VKIGLKTFVSNLNYIPQTIDFYSAKFFDYIEVYLEAGVSRNYISKWIETGIPLAFHAPHSYGGFNPSVSDKAEDNQIIMQEIADVCSSYSPLYLVFHPGIQGNINETIRQFDRLLNLHPHLRDFMLIENKPLFGMRGELCLGATPEDIKLICESTGMKFCLDFGHAICAAASFKLNWKDYIERFITLIPSAFHLSDGHVASGNDEHLHFTQGDYDIPWCLSKVSKNSFLALETEKNSLDSLDDFLEDVKYVKSIIKRET